MQHYTTRIIEKPNLKLISSLQSVQQRIILQGLHHKIAAQNLCQFNAKGFHRKVRHKGNLEQNNTQNYVCTPAAPVFVLRSLAFEKSYTRA